MSYLLVMLGKRRTKIASTDKDQDHLAHSKSASDAASELINKKMDREDDAYV